MKRLAQRDSCWTMDWPNYFPIDFLASRAAQDPHEQYRMCGLEPYTSDSRGRFFCTQKSWNICSLHRHWDWILSVCLCRFLSRLIQTNSAKWVWLSNLLRKFINSKMVVHFQIVYLQFSHVCLIYGQISTTALFVNSKCPWCTNKSKHYINHINLTHPQSWQTPTPIP